MINRIMRVIIFYDLPTVTAAEKKNHHLFRKYLKGKGFIMLQESVYSKLTLNSTSAKTAAEDVKRHLPPDGLVQLFTVTEKQYSSIDTLLGNADKNTDVINTAFSVVVF